MAIKCVFGFKNGRSTQKDLESSKPLLGKKLGDIIRGDLIGFDGYEFQIMGGSDDAGFPMRRDVPGFGRRRILATQSTGVRDVPKGIKIRKTVTGSIVSPKIVQINLKVLKEGKDSLLPPPKEEAKAEAKPA